MRDGPLCEPVRLESGARLRVERVRFADAAPANTRLNHFHDVGEVVLFEQVHGALLLGDRAVPLTDGMLVYVPPLAYHDFALSPGAKAWRLIQFDPVLPSGRREAPAAAVAVTPSTVDWAALLALADWLAVEGGMGPAAGAALETLLWIVRRQPALEGDSRPDGPERFRDLVARLQDDPGLAPPLPAAASLCGLSPAYFSRRFQTAFGLSYSAYVEGLRLNRAARRLLDGDTPVSSVGYEVGFASPSYFTQRFRRRFGVTPSGFRSPSAASAQEDDRVSMPPN